MGGDYTKIGGRSSVEKFKKKIGGRDHWVPSERLPITDTVFWCHV